MGLEDGNMSKEDVRVSKTDLYQYSQNKCIGSEY